MVIVLPRPCRHQFLISAPKTHIGSDLVSQTRFILRPFKKIFIRAMLISSLIIPISGCSSFFQQIASFFNTELQPTKTFENEISYRKQLAAKAPRVKSGTYCYREGRYLHLEPEICTKHGGRVVRARGGLSVLQNKAPGRIENAPVTAVETQLLMGKKDPDNLDLLKPFNPDRSSETDKSRAVYKTSMADSADTPKQKDHGSCYREYRYLNLPVDLCWRNGGVVVDETFIPGPQPLEKLFKQPLSDFSQGRLSDPSTRLKEDNSLLQDSLLQDSLPQDSLAQDSLAQEEEKVKIRDQDTQARSNLARVTSKTRKENSIFIAPHKGLIKSNKKNPGKKNPGKKKTNLKIKDSVQTDYHSINTPQTRSIIQPMKLYQNVERCLAKQKLLRLQKEACQRIGGIWWQGNVLEDLQGIGRPITSEAVDSIVNTLQNDPPVHDTESINPSAKRLSSAPDIFLSRNKQRLASRSSSSWEAIVPKKGTSQLHNQSRLFCYRETRYLTLTKAQCTKAGGVMVVGKPDTKIPPAQPIALPTPRVEQILLPLTTRLPDMILAHP